MIRQCIFCKRTITACNGFCMGRDILRILRGEKNVKVGEICGWCMMVLDCVIHPEETGVELPK